MNALDLPAAALEAGVRHADPHSGDGSLSGSHLASPISMHYLGPPPFRVPQTLREFPGPTQEIFAAHGLVWMRRRIAGAAPEPRRRHIRTAELDSESWSKGRSDTAVGMRS